MVVCYDLMYKQSFHKDITKPLPRNIVAVKIVHIRDITVQARAVLAIFHG